MPRFSNLGQGRKLAQACRGRRNARLSERLSPASSDRDTPQPADQSAQVTLAKSIVPQAAHAHDSHAALVSILGRDRREEARRLAELRLTLRAGGFVADFSDVAILLHSVKRRHSLPYLAALRDAGIPVRVTSSRNGPDGDADDPGDGGQRRDQVLLTTIHQAKGREWPAAVVGLPRLCHQRPERPVDHLGKFRAHGDTEPPERAEEFDLRRQYYVAFSRAKRLLAFTGTNPDTAFAPALSRARVWPDVGPLGLEISHGGRARVILGGKVLQPGS